MTEYIGSYDNFIQGVSQQPESQRVPGQVTEQINCLSSVVHGLTRRPNLELFANLSLDTHSNFYTYDRGDGQEKYLIYTYNDAIKVINLETGADCVVNKDVALGFNYITGAGAGDLKFSTIGDTTFIANANKIPAMNTPSYIDTKHRWIFHLKKASFGITYEIRCQRYAGLIDTAATVTTPDTAVISATEADKRISLDTLDILTDLKDYLNNYATLRGWTDYDIWAENGIIYLISDTYKEFSVMDGNGNSELMMTYTSVQSYDDLPNTAAAFINVKVKGADDSDANDYYVEFIPDLDTSTPSSGHWEEALAPGLDQHIISTYMPHTLTRTGVDTFYFGAKSWVDRGAGDDLSNPVPSFIGRGITDIAFYKNRMVLSTADTVCASAVDDYYNFFSSTVVTTEPDGPLDSESSGAQVANLHHMLPFHGSLVTFGEESQYVHSGSTAFDLKNFALNPTSNYGSTPICRPAVSSDKLYVPFKKGTHTGIRAFSMDDLTGNFRGYDLTEHVPSYLAGTCKKVVVSNDHNILFVLASSYELYVYQWYQSGNEVKQQAWHKWTFPQVYAIKDIACIHSKLYVVYRSSSSTYQLGFLDLTKEALPGTANLCHMDYGQGVIATDTGSTYDLTIPSYFIDNDLVDYLCITPAYYFSETGTELNPSRYVISGSTISINKEGLTFNGGDLKFILGVPYVSGITLTRPFVKDQLGRSKIGHTLRIKDMHFALENTGYIDFTFHAYGASKTISFDSNLIGVLTLNQQRSLVDYVLRAPLRVRSDKLQITASSDKLDQFNLISASWNGTHREKGRRTN